jgi:spore coat protein SA
MKRRIFHILPESEPFSDYSGGAISRWVANVTRFDDDAVIIAPEGDSTWRAGSTEVRIASGLERYRKANLALGHCSLRALRIAFIRFILSRNLKDLHAGDTVWVHNRPEVAMAIGKLARARGARLVLHLHNSHLAQSPRQFVHSLHVDTFVFVSKFLRDEALDRVGPIGNTTVIHNGADVTVFHPASTPNTANAIPVVLFAGRLVPEKGLHIFMDAMRILRDKGIPIRGVVVGGVGFGDAAPSAYLSEMQHSAPANVFFHRYCVGYELAEIFRSADIFCLPSCWDEPLGMAPLEAMATGLPIVVSNSGGLPEVLCGGGGLLVERNSSAALAKALSKLATSPSMRNRLATEALASYKANFTWQVVHRAYREVLNRRSHIKQALSAPGYRAITASPYEQRP